MTDTLTDALGRLTREDLVEVILEAVEAYGRRGQLLAALVLYRAMDDAGRRALRERAADLAGPVDGLGLWLNAIDGLGWE